jgi:hypothetical protein
VKLEKKVDMNDERNDKDEKKIKDKKEKNEKKMEIDKNKKENKEEIVYDDNENMYERLLRMIKFGVKVEEVSLKMKDEGYEKSIIEKKKMDVKK